jgi:hypothetical protein
MQLQLSPHSQHETHPPLQSATSLQPARMDAKLTWAGIAAAAPKAKPTAAASLSVHAAEFAAPAPKAAVPSEASTAPPPFIYRGSGDGGVRCTAPVFIAAFVLSCAFFAGASR